MRTETELRAKIKDIQSDERLHYPTATVFENAPLALIQLDMESKITAPKWALGEYKELVH